MQVSGRGGCWPYLQMLVFVCQAETASTRVCERGSQHNGRRPTFAGAEQESIQTGVPPRGRVLVCVCVRVCVSMCVYV